MRAKVIISLILGICLLANSANASLTEKTDFNSFWSKFKSAVKKKDKAGVLRLTRLPISMPYGVPTVRARAQFFRKYEFIFNGEANAAKCFAVSAPVKISPKVYEVACGFKDDPDGSAGTPIVYRFELKKAGWKFVSLDNINE